MEIQKKLLTRIRLVNWHYFENETVSLHGSTLVSGENTAGKSTILDAIQLVLTTNTRKFNTAANEKGNRDLKGYIRCKIGNVGETYLRKNAVISNVALEFYEEKTEKYFVLGVHMTSADEESGVMTKWYIEECRLENLSFLTENKPSLQNEFRVNGKKIIYIEQKNAARDRFKRRMGNLEDRFFDIIPKSLAFKPMDNVKEFINKFVLPQEFIDVVSLRTNIETLSDLEELIEKSNCKLELLTTIVTKYQEVCEKDKDILVNDFLITRANLDYYEEEIERIKNEIAKHNQYIEANDKQSIALAVEIREMNARLIALNVAANANESNQLLEHAKRKVAELELKIEEQIGNIKRLENDGRNIKSLLTLLQKKEISIINKSEFETFLAPLEPKKKADIFQKIKSGIAAQIGKVQIIDVGMQVEMNKINAAIEALQQRLRELENRKLTYPDNTIKLKKAIESEFIKRGIKSKVFIVAELLEITDELWKNAVEGYFNTQKFNLIVEPEFYSTALNIYNRNQHIIHTAGIVNTRRLEMGSAVDNQSLAYVVHSENRYAKAYANYVLGRVVRCSNVKELDVHPISITSDCMLYQGYVVRNLDPATYRNPYIGQNAYRVQIVNTKQELEVLSSKRRELREEKQTMSDILEAGKRINPDLTATYMDAPFYHLQYKEQITDAKKELKEASNDPTLIEINLQIENSKQELDKLESEKSGIQNENQRLILQNEGYAHSLEATVQNQKTMQADYNERTDINSECKAAADEKYRYNRKTKSAKTVMENFTPQKVQLLNAKDELLNGNGGLTEQQDRFNHKFEQDFLRGMTGIREYIDAKAQLEAVELIRFEEQLKKAKEDCEEVFKSDFLAKMRNYIENARNEFRSLNKALQDIYYGDDSYHFLITFDKKKESLYRMITSENNHEGLSLWTQAFEAEYKEEMAELFAKLVTKDDKGQNVIEEYTDYRSYLDYDIEIHKKNGVVQKFSSIYAEKSGSETQVPYYVAIAASFYQLYRLGNSVRIMLLDEAFDKMDDERIGSMMNFFNSLQLQVIMATPPSKIEIIGENVSTILTAIRVGTNSIVEEYDL